jgi:hypothetical protein
MNQNDLYIIQMNIARYRAMLQFDMNAEKRSMVERLLGEAEENLKVMEPADDRRA